MAKVNSYIKLGGKDFTGEEFGEILTQEFQEDVEYALAEAVGAIVNALQEFIDDLNKNSTMRGRGFSAVRYNQPMQDAQVVVNLLNDKNGFPQYQIEVDDYIFNLLDRGRPPRITKSKETMLTYDGKLTEADSLNINVGAVVTGHIHTIPAGKTIQGFTPRRFFVNAAKKFRPKKVKRNKKLPSFPAAPGSVDIASIAPPTPRFQVLEFDPNIQVRVIKRAK